MSIRWSDNMHLWGEFRNKPNYLPAPKPPAIVAPPPAASPAAVTQPGSEPEPPLVLSPVNIRDVVARATLGLELFQAGKNAEALSLWEQTVADVEQLDPKRPRVAEAQAVAQDIRVLLRLYGPATS